MSDAYNFGFSGTPSWMSSIQGGLLGAPMQPQGGLLSAPPQAQPMMQYPHRPGVNTILGALDNLLLGGAVQKAQQANYEAKMTNAQNAYLPQAIGAMFGGGGPPPGAPQMGQPQMGGAGGAPSAMPAGPTGAPQLPTGQGTPPSMAQVGPVPHGLNIRDPATQRTIATLGMLGSPLAGTLTTIGSATMPKFSAVRPGGIMANEATGELVGNAAPDGGTQNIPDPDNPGQFINVPVQGAASNAAAYAGATAGGKAAGESVGKLPYAAALAQAEAAGKGAGEAPYALETRVGADGSPITATRDYFLKHPLIGQNPAAAAYNSDQAKDLAGVISADQGQRAPAMLARDNALRAVDIAQSTHFGPDAPGRQSAARWLQAMGIKGDASDYADKTAAYEQIANQSLLQFAKSNLPARYTERELTFTKTIFGQIKDPQIAALFSAGTQAAIANKQIARAAYADSYDPATGMTRKQYEAGWAQTPEGSSSIYADPVWQHIQIGGKPAVQPVTVRGHTALIVSPGLHPTVLKVN